MTDKDKFVTLMDEFRLTYDVFPNYTWDTGKRESGCTVEVNDSLYETGVSQLNTAPASFSFDEDGKFKYFTTDY